MSEHAKPAPPGRLLAALLALAVLIRLAAAVYLGDVVEPVSGAFDQVSYDTLAQRLLSGHGFSFPQDWYPFTPAGEQTAHWSFAYTLYLSGVYALSGHHPLAARVVQVLLSGLTGWYLYRLGRRLFGEAAGLAAVSLWALYAYLVFFNAVLMTQTFYIICVLAALDQSQVIAAQRGADGSASRTWASWLILGLALGLGTLLRQTLLLFAPLMLVWLAWRRRQGDQTASGTRARRLPAWLGGPLLSIAVVAACVLPFTAYNYATFHDFLLLNSNGGFFFWASNHPTQGTNFDPNYVPPLPAALVGMSEPALDRELYREALGYMLGDPLRFFQLSLNRMKDYFWVLPSDQSSGLSNLARTLSFALYAPFMLAGLVLSRQRWRECMPLYLYLAFDTVLHLSSWAAPRYRLPSDTILMLFAGYCAVRLATSPRAAAVMSAASSRLRRVPGPPAAGLKSVAYRWLSGACT